MKTKTRNQVIFSRLILVFGLFSFGVIIARMCYLSLSKQVDGVDLQKFASKRTTAKQIIPAKRGTIYDCNGNVLAENVSSYTLIAYLSKKRTIDDKKPQHVVNKEETAEKLAPILGMEKEKVLKLLNKKAYQTEFGAKGRGLTELTKSKIEELNLPGLDFIETQKRYYPNGDFLSYTLGYAKADENGNIVGEMGLEKLYNDKLSGTDGFIEYQKDAKGYKIPGTNEIRQDAIDGEDIHLTIDQSVQLIVDDAMKDAYKNYSYEWFTIMVADASTGAVLASTSSPSFNPNLRNMDNYLDYNVGLAYEPGSTMKIWSFMAAMEAGVYKGDDTYKSGSYTARDGTVINDWDPNGWGYITYDKGFQFSSNVAAMNLVNKMSGNYLRNFYKKLGFGSKTGIELANEVSGSLNFTYETEILNASFGQGITTTPIQNIKALTTLSNKGTVLNPYIISEIKDHNTGEVSYKNSRKEQEKVASEATVNKLKELMYLTVNGPGNTGVLYKLDGYPLAGKTGTAQIADTFRGGYLRGDSDVVSSLSAIYPKDNPKIVLYASLYKPMGGNPAAINNAVKAIIKNVTTYYNIDINVRNQNEVISHYKLKSYINKSREAAVIDLSSNNITSVVIGNGDRVIDQYPERGITVNSKEKCFLLTNGNIAIPNMSGWSKKDVKEFCRLAGIDVIFNGTGYVKEQSIPINTKVERGTKLSVTLTNKYGI